MNAIPKSSARLRVSATRRSLEIVACLTCAATARAEPSEHVVKANETCAALAQHYYGDSRLVDVIHRANPSLASSPPPHVLREGMVLTIPPRPASAGGPDAQLTRVRNQVEVLTPETKPGKPNDPLFRGNRVSTQAASAADVTFRDETQVRLGERTLVIILGDAKSAAAPVQTALMTGNLRTWMAGARKEPTTIATDAASVRVKSGEAQVTSDAVKTTRLAVYDGASEIDARGTTRKVGPGFGSKAELGKAPTPPRPLPPAPRWKTQPPPVLLDSPKGAPSIIGEYEAPRDHAVSEWHVQVAIDDRFQEIVVDKIAPAEKHRFEGRLPTRGHYFIRVSALDDDHFEGPFGPTAHVVVMRVTILKEGGRRQLMVDPPDTACMRVGNTKLTWVKGTIDVGPNEPIRLRCAPTENDPTTLFAF